jgi:hypothetical protein
VYDSTSSSFGGLMKSLNAIFPAASEVLLLGVSQKYCESLRPHLR